jgi:hypothetical protein
MALPVYRDEMGNEQEDAEIAEKNQNLIKIMETLRPEKSKPVPRCARVLSVLCSLCVLLLKVVNWFSC